LNRQRARAVYWPSDKMPDPLDPSPLLAPFRITEWPNSDLGIAGWTKSLTDAPQFTKQDLLGDLEFESGFVEEAHRST
jgi:hypothetical protein